jgi:hypothetical protein
MATKLIRRVTTEVFEEEVRRPKGRASADEDAGLDGLDNEADEDESDEEDADAGDEPESKPAARPAPKKQRR